MEIMHDHSYASQAEQELIAHGYACESFYSLRLSYVLTEDQQAENSTVGEDDRDAYAAAVAQRTSGHMERVAAALAQDLEIFQYSGEDKVPYDSDWDLFFWCNSFSTTMPGHLSGRDYRYFTLSFNKKHSPERRQETYNRAMRVLDQFADDANLHVAVQYEAVLDDAKIRRDAKLAIPGLAGRKCAYRGMEGRLETNGERLFFRKKRSRKYVYPLSDAEILRLSWKPVLGASGTAAT